MADNHLLWMDLETTGLDGDQDDIIEIGCIITTPDLVELGEFTRVVRPSPKGLERLMKNQIVRDMHSSNGLLFEVQSADSIIAVETELLNWIHETVTDSSDEALVEPGSLVLAGSGVGHHDLTFVQYHLPPIADLLTYWVIDVGVLRRAHEMWVGTDVSAANDAKTHRAIDDIRCHLEEARAFRDLWRATQIADSETTEVLDPDWP
jgi:oligoribonuclease